MSYKIFGDDWMNQQIQLEYEIYEIKARIMVKCPNCGHRMNLSLTPIKLSLSFYVSGEIECYKCKTIIRGYGELKLKIEELEEITRNGV